MRKAPIRPIPEAKKDQLLTLDASNLDTPERVIQYCINRGLIKECITDIEALINSDEKLILVYKDLGNLDAHLKLLDDENKYEIAINSKHAKTRQRFSMAHEYAHYLLHKKLIHTMTEGEQILHRSEERNPIEYQANQFASDILMPETTFKEQVKQLEGNISHLAKAFNVSQIAVRYRAKSLGMSGHGV